MISSQAQIAVDVKGDGTCDAKVIQGDIREFLHKLFKFEGLSYSISPELQGSVTLSATNVDYMTLLDDALRQVNATYRIQGGVYQIEPKVPDHVVIAGPDPNVYTVITSGPASASASAMVQDKDFLYVLIGDTLVKVRKSDLAIIETKTHLTVPRRSLIDGGPMPMVPQDDDGILVRRNGRYEIAVRNREVRGLLTGLLNSPRRNFDLALDVQGTVTLTLHNAALDVALKSILDQVHATYHIENATYVITKK